MKVLGLIVEYNPFHNGHLYHIEQSKKVSGADFVICIMSGNFIQRGEPAIVNKWARTKMALLGGADLVIELPVVYAMSSAEYFAFGALKRFLESFYEKQLLNLDDNVEQWINVYQKPLEVVDIISALEDNGDRFNISMYIQIGQFDVHTVTHDNYNDVIKGIICLFYEERNEDIEYYNS